MKIIDPPIKTNWKFIIIVAIVTLLLGGGAWWYGKMLTEADLMQEQKYLRDSTREDEQENKIAGWQTYRNDEFGFEFRYPRVLAEDEACRPRESTVAGWVYIGSRISIQIAAFPRGKNLTEFVEAELALTEFNELVKKSIMIGDEEGLHVSYETKNRGRYGETAYVLRNGKIYIFVFTTGEEECSVTVQNNISELSIFQQILSTFRFVE